MRITLRKESTRDDLKAWLLLNIIFHTAGSCTSRIHNLKILPGKKFLAKINNLTSLNIESKSELNPNLTTATGNFFIISTRGIFVQGRTLGVVRCVGANETQ